MTVRIQIDFHCDVDDHVFHSITGSMLVREKTHYY
jgi:hypothetical protein